LLSVSLITVFILAAGVFFWTSGDTVLGDTGTAAGAWSLGSEEAPLIIDMYPDFT